MRLHSRIADHHTVIHLRDEGAQVFAEVDGRSYALDVHESADGYLLVSDGRVFDCRLDGRAESGKSVDVVVDITNYAITLTDPKRLRVASNAVAHADQAARIVAPMPGKVVRVLVAVGDQVKVDSGIVVVEAMKMQNEMKSPKAGTVVVLNCEVGATVNGGDVLAVIE